MKFSFRRRRRRRRPATILCIRFIPEIAFSCHSLSVSVSLSRAHDTLWSGAACAFVEAPLPSARARPFIYCLSNVSVSLSVLGEFPLRSCRVFTRNNCFLISLKNCTMTMTIGICFNILYAVAMCVKLFIFCFLCTLRI
jgi:hypothetical protein